MRATAAIATTPGGSLELDEIELDAPRDDEILVRMRASGVCHTDLSAAAGRLPVQMPIVLGHEGAGVVEQVGSRVSSFAPGDRVLLAPDFCGRCVQCRTGATTYCEQSAKLIFGGTRLDGTTKATRSGAPVRAGFFGQSSFSQRALVTERNLLRIESDAPWEHLAALGCGVSTGAASVIHALEMRAGHSLAVFGAGTVGLAAVMAARMIGVDSIVVVDRHPARLSLARELGATHTVDTTEEADVAGAVRAPVGGADRVLDTTGVPALLRAGVDALATRGVCGFVAGAGSRVELDLGPMLAKGAQLRGIMGGDATGLVFLSRLVDAHRAGRFPLERIVKTYPLARIGEAFADMASGATIKPVIVFDDDDT